MSQARIFAEFDAVKQDAVGERVEKLEYPLFPDLPEFKGLNAKSLAPTKGTLHGDPQMQSWKWKSCTTCSGQASSAEAVARRPSAMPADNRLPPWIWATPSNSWPS
ncbi:hypothetical protein LSM04_005527 [Trypanosoma melophagium]|uniref:uncharacterized protein n=1 Tax=Trypanosoma melophagium TaxID=715481 RepID=UPI00351A98B7|nr:hypothetical protein LSM04_005527 [Trypanosoma melophagium]